MQNTAQAFVPPASTKSLNPRFGHWAVSSTSRFVLRIFWVYGYTQNAVAQALEIHGETLSRYTNGHLSWPTEIKDQMVEWFGELFFEDETHATGSDGLDD